MAHQTLAGNPAGALRIELISGYNFVVDSNVETPATYAPRSAYLGATYHNDGATPLTNLVAYIGNFNGGNSPTPGLYPSRTHAGLNGTFALAHEGGSQGLEDATRILGTIAPGESKTVYWLVSYPNLDADGKAVYGGVKPDDDLWLHFDVWGAAYEGATLRTADVRRQVFMRRMLSAMANKISPNNANKVPQEYKDLLLQYEPAWTNNLVDGSPGSAIITEGVWYDLGNINQGFDNDGDLIPDYNAWLQPVGDPSIFDAGCFRLVRTYALVVIKRTGGQPDTVILAENELYFSNLPPDNNGAIGYVAYEFMPLCSGASATLSPYQAVASGKDNEKFNGDFGATLGGGLTSTESSVEIDKQVDLAVAGAGSNLNYTVAFTNTGAVAVGRPDLGLPLVVSDTIPAGSTYVAGSAAAGNTLPVGVTAYTIFYSTNNAVDWVQAEPVPAAAVTDIQWWLSDPLEAGAGGTVTFAVTVNNPPPPLVYNVAGLGLGDALPFLEDDATTLVTGDYLISGTVFADIGTGGGTFGNGILDGAEAGIPHVTVTLYYDINGNGILDDDDVLYATTVSTANGTYTFNSLPNGNYLVVVDDLDADLPQGYTLTTTGTRTATINNADSTGNNFGFAPGLILTKTGPALLEKDGQATYTIAVSNSLPATSQTVQYTAWATNNVTIVPANTAFTNPQNALGQNNGSLATADMAVNTDYQLGLGGYTISAQSGTITNVLVVLHFDNTAYTRNRTDTLTLNVRTNTNTAIAPVFTVTYSIPNNLGIGVKGTLTNTVTSALNWDLSYFNPANNKLYVDFTTTRQGGGQANTMGIDAVGFIVTTSDSVGVLANVPLYDYYDTNVLQYANSAPDISSSDSNGPAPNTGRLVWDNVGPLAPGASTNVMVTFNVIGPPGNAGTITTNRAAVTNATYITGGLANAAFDEAVSEVPATASIGDTIFWDANRSGSQDDSEAGIPGVAVELYDANSNRVAIATTDANGNYLFTGLAPGTYTVLVVTNDVGNYPLNEAALSAHPDNDGAPIGDPLATVSNNMTTVTVIGGQDYRGADFGYVPPGATIGGVLWIDFNDDGIRNGGESTIAFITVTLLDGDGNVVATTETDADGNYLFYGLPDGEYRVVVDTGDADFPSGLAQTVDPDGNLDSEATTIEVSGGTIVTIDGDPWTAGDLNVNFGYRYTGNNSLSGTVGMDDPDNIDGVLNGANTSGVGANETAYAGVTVYVYLWNDDGNGVVNSGETVLLGTTVTDANGDYSFANLPDGGVNDYYIVSLVAPNAFLSLTTTTSDTPATLLVETENAQGHTLSAYQAIPIAAEIENVDFAFISVVDYDFGDLPDGYRTTLANDGPRHIIADTNSPTLFLGALLDTENNGLPSVGADGDDLDNLDDEDGVFVVGIWQNGDGGATVRVQVGAGAGWLVGFVDFDNSGAFDNANELVVSQAVASNGGPGSDGAYAFSVDVPAGALATTNSTFFYSRWRLLPSQPFLPSLAYQGEASNGEVEDYRWGFHVIGGAVFMDDGSSLNAFDAADSPQPGVVVNLYDNGTLIATTVTDFDGAYRFYGVPEGDYRVTLVEPDGATAILDADGGANSMTNIAVTIDDASVFGRDFLLDTNAAVSAISGTVYNDTDTDSLFSSGDTPVGGATVALYRDLNGDGVAEPNEFIGTVTTGPDGGYRFEGLPNGDYLIVLTTPEGAINVNDVEGLADDGLVAVTLMGSDATNQDFLLANLNTYSLESYRTDAYLIVTNLYYRDPEITGQTQDVIYVGGPGFVPNGAYDVAYYDAEGLLVYVDTTAQATGAGFLQSVNPNTNPDVYYGTWTAVVIPDGATPAGTLVAQLADPATIITDTFEVRTWSTTVFTDADGNPATVYGSSNGVGVVYIQTIDRDQNQDPLAIETITVTLTNAATGDWETVVLYETGPDTGVFANDADGNRLAFPITIGGAAIPENGELSYEYGDTLQVRYVDAADATDRSGSVVATHVLISAFDVYRLPQEGSKEEAPGVVVEWITASEFMTAGFYLERQDGPAWIRVHAGLVDAVPPSPSGARYRVVDAAAGEGPLTYRLIEQEVFGVQNTYGPFAMAPGKRDAAPAGASIPAVMREVDTEAPREGARRRQTARAIRDASAAAVRAASITGAHDRVKIEIREAGLYALDANTIAAAAGQDVATVARGIVSGHLALSRGGQPVSWAAHNGRLVFYADRRETTYTDREVFWLERGVRQPMAVRRGAASQPVTSRLSYPHTARFEENRYAPVSALTDAGEDFWFWEFINAGHATTGTRRFPFRVDDVVGGSPAATLVVDLAGTTRTAASPDHHAVVALNGHTLGAARWDGVGAKRLTFHVPAGVLRGGENELVLTGLLDPGVPFSIFYLNAFEVTYPRAYRAVNGALTCLPGGNLAITADGFGGSMIRVFEIGNPDRPVLIQSARVERGAVGYQVSFPTQSRDRRYLIAEEYAVKTPLAVTGRTLPLLDAADQRADYVIVTPPALRASAETLAARRTAQGLAVKIVDLEDAYDVFNHGRAEPDGIRRLLRAAHTTWTVPPRYALLLGAGHYDFRDALGHGGNLIPPMMVSSPVGVLPSDVGLGNAVGDSVPEVVVGRLPVLSAAEFDRVFAKMVAYEDRVAGVTPALMAADNRDAGGNFPADSRELGALLGEPVAYIDLQPGQTAAFRTALANGFRAGHRVINWSGHGGIGALASEGALRTSDVPGLNNAATPPLVVALSCTINQFGVPGLDALGEVLVTDANGAAAVWAPTSMTFNRESMHMGRGFYAAMADGATRLGDVVGAAHRHYRTEGSVRHTHNLYQLLGDPALALNPAPEARGLIAAEPLPPSVAGPRPRALVPRIVGTWAVDVGDGAGSTVGLRLILPPGTPAADIRVEMARKLELADWRPVAVVPVPAGSVADGLESWLLDVPAPDDDDPFFLRVWVEGSAGESAP